MSATAAFGRAVSLPLTLRGGGYDFLVRGEVGVTLWWIVLVGAAAGVLPAARLRWAAWEGIGLLVAFGAWTPLSATWAESS